MATIVTKNSSTASAVPTTSDLVQGELAVNVTDKRIFTENASTQIVELGTNPSTITTGSATVTGTLTANGTFASNNAVITGGSINSTPIGATTPSTVRGSTVTATTGFVGGLTGNVTGNLTGNVTGNVVGNLTGNVTGNVTASTGTTTLNNLVVNGTADFTNTKLTNITTPTLDSDAANKGYVDATVAAVIDSAPAALDTLNELAAALGDDANFSATVTTALATKLPLAGGTMTGAIAMGTSKITGLGDPTASQDAATKIYVDTADNLKLNLSGGTMSGAIAMGTNKITGLGDPTLAQDAATKAYTDSILGSATSAAASAAAAATSESNAATSASNAATSETNALNSANAAASSYDQFDDRYLGDKASDPTLDNDGNALLTGALYFNTTTDVMRVYTGSAWQDVAISTNSPTFTGTVTADGLSLGDNEKATFGAGNDLEIYHDGSNSYIDDVGTGSLIARASTTLALQTRNSGDTAWVSSILADNGSGVRLFTNGSKKLETTATGIDVTGTATMDGLTVDTDTLYVDSVNNRVGIGTSSPASLLHVQGSSASGIIQLGTTGGTTSREWKHIVSSSTGYYFLQDTTAGSNRITVDTSGNVGIGTTSPAYDIEVNKNAATSIIGIRSSDTGEARIQFGDQTSGNVGRIGYDNTDNSMAFRVNNAERLRIDSSGNVGIGTSSPAYTLDVDGDVRFYDSSSSSANYYFEADHYCQINITGDKDASAGGPYNTAITANGSNGDLELKTNNLRRVVIDQSGNVGIGTTSPSSFYAGAQNLVVGSGSGESGMTIYSSATNYGNIYFADGTSGSAPYAGYIEYNHTNNFFRFGANAAERMRIDSSGNLLVGTTSDLTDAYLQSGGVGFALRSNDQLAVSRSGSTPVQFNRNTNDGEIVAFRKDGTTVGSIGTLGGYTHFISGTGGIRPINNTQLRPVNSDGTGSDGTMDLGTSGIRFKDLYLSNAVRLDTGNLASNPRVYFDNDNFTGLSFIEVDRGTNAMEFWNQGSERMRIDSSGNLLVGTTSSVSTSSSQTGAEIRGNGISVSAVNSNPCTIVNRIGTDGDITLFRKNGTTVGSIASTFGVDIHIGTGNTRLRFVDTNNYIRPANSDGSGRDAATDLGVSSARFKDLYLSGTANVANVKETVYALTGTALDAGNGGIQTKTLAANTTFTDSLASGESLVLQLEAGASYTVTWPTMQWVTSGGNVAPTLTAKDTLVFWKVSTTLYGAYTGSYV